MPTLRAKLVTGTSVLTIGVLLAGQVQGIGSTPVEFNFVSDNMRDSFPGKIALTGADQQAFLINYAASAAIQFPADGALETFQRVTTP